jgi:hypothetical protein
MTVDCREPKPLIGETTAGVKGAALSVHARPCMAAMERKRLW